MRYALETNNGVMLLTGSTPLPDGSIEPIPNWDDVFPIPSYYLKIVNGIVTEKTQEEKDIYDINHPPSIEKIQEDAHTLLDDTDLYVIRNNDPGCGKEVPQDIVDERSNARDIL